MLYQPITSLNQQKIIQEIRKNPHITQIALSEIVGISAKSIKENMKKLQENEIIRRVGADKNGYWEMVDNEYNNIRYCS